jgi:hypothetical protein
MTPTPEDYAAARKLVAEAFYGGVPANGCAVNRYHHDLEELWSAEFLEPPSRSNKRDLRYWLETGNLVREYLMLQAGTAYNDTLRQRFIAWVRRSPDKRRQYEEGDDMARAALVDWFLRVVR